MKDQQYPLTKQQLFVNPISIAEKQKAKISPVNLESRTIQKVQLNREHQTQNFNDLLLSAVDPQIDQNHKHNSKSKYIFKKQPSLTPAQIKQKNYRTRMCPQGIECKKRLVCQFAHTQYELRRPYKNRKNPCVRYQKGLCSLGSACPDYHGNMDLKKKNYKYKVEKCRDFFEKGACSKGKLCIYIHDEEEIGDNEVQSLQNGQNMKIENDLVEAQQVQKQENQQQQITHDTNKNQAQSEQKNKASVKFQAKDIFNKKSESKKAIIATQVVQQIIEKTQQSPENQNKNQQENFNIEFNF